MTLYDSCACKQWGYTTCIDNKLLIVIKVHCERGGVGDVPWESINLFGSWPFPKGP